MDFWRKKLRTRAGEFASLRMWLMAACLSACLLRSGALRVMFCLRSAFNTIPRKA